MRKERNQSCLRCRAAWKRTMPSNEETKRVWRRIKQIWFIAELLSRQQRHTSNGNVHFFHSSPIAHFCYRLHFIDKIFAAIPDKTKFARKWHFLNRYLHYRSWDTKFFRREDRKVCCVALWGAFDLLSIHSLPRCANTKQLHAFSTTIRLCFLLNFWNKTGERIFHIVHD